MIADIEELAKMDSSEIYHRKISAKGSIDVIKREKNSFSQSQTVQQNCWEETMNSENPLQGGNNLQGVKISVENFKAKRKGFNRQNQKMTLKPGDISGRFKVTSSVVITMNLEFNSMCRRKKHSLVH